jgi:FSR family fosmidomycin resistance protein-like MFS transporter
MLGGSLGFGIGPLLGAGIATVLNWHIAYVILGLPALVAGILVFTRMKSEGIAPIKSSSSIPTAGQKSKTVWQVFKPIIGIISVSIAMALATGPIMSFISLFLIDVHHLSAAAGSMWVTIIRVGGLAGNLIGGWLTDKWGRRNTIFLVLILYGPLALMVARLPFGFGLGAVFVLYGLLMAMREATIQTLLMDNAPPHLRATIIGIYFSFGQQGSSIIQPVAGDIMDMIGIGGVFNGISFISLGLSFLAVLLLLRQVVWSRRTGHNGV